MSPRRATLLDLRADVLDVVANEEATVVLTGGSVPSAPKAPGWAAIGGLTTVVPCVHPTPGTLLPHPTSQASSDGLCAIAVCVPPDGASVPALPAGARRAPVGLTSCAAGHACRRLTRGTRTGRRADRTLVPQVQSVHAGPNGALAAVSDQGDVVAWSADPASTPKLVWPMRRAAWRVRNLSLGLCDLAPPTFPQHALC